MGRFANPVLVSQRVQLGLVGLHGVGEQDKLGVGENGDPRDGVGETLAAPHVRANRSAELERVTVEHEYAAAVGRVQEAVGGERQADDVLSHRAQRVGLLLRRLMVGALEFERTHVVDVDEAQVVEQADELLTRAHHLTHQTFLIH